MPQYISPPPSYTYEISADADTQAFAKMTELKMKLNATKTKMDRMNPAELTQKLQFVDPYFATKRAIEKRFGAEHVTNAWIKMMQILRVFDLVRTPVDRIFCNAELPGAFIFAINHYCHDRFGRMNAWWASSLIGHSDVSKNYLDDDYGLVDKYPEKWLMRALSVSGDVTVKDVRKKYFQEIGGTIDLYTSDLGFAVTDYNEQERAHIPAHIGAAVMGLESLAAGGSMVLKMYTIFEPETLNFLDSLVPLFKHFYIYKPPASRITNSEIYIVATELKKKMTFAAAEKLASPYKKIVAVNSDMYFAAQNIYGAQIENLERAYNIQVIPEFRQAVDVHTEFRGLRKLKPNERLTKK